MSPGQGKYNLQTINIISFLSPSLHCVSVNLDYFVFIMDCCQLTDRNKSTLNSTTDLRYLQGIANPTQLRFYCCIVSLTFSSTSTSWMKTTSMLEELSFTPNCLNELDIYFFTLVKYFRLSSM